MAFDASATRRPFEVGNASAMIGVARQARKLAVESRKMETRHQTRVLVCELGTGVLVGRDVAVTVETSGVGRAMPRLVACGALRLELLVTMRNGSGGIAAMQREHPHQRNRSHQTA